MSAGTTECNTPESPPTVNSTMKPSEKSIDVLSLIEPFQIVPNQLKIFTPVGMAMSIVARPNAEMATGPSPVTNMWCAHTPQPRNPIAMPENTTIA